MTTRRTDGVLAPRHRIFRVWSAAFTRSVELAVAGRPEEARREFETIDGRALAFWFHTVAQYAGADRMAGRPRTTPSRGDRPGRMPPRSVQRKCLVRDNWCCRYCGSPLLLRGHLDTFRGIIGEDAFPLGRTNLSKHGSYFLHVASLDHLRPWSDAGSNEHANLVSSCHACNFGKADFSLEELGLIVAPTPDDAPTRRWVRVVGLLDQI